MMRATLLLLAFAALGAVPARAAQDADALSSAGLLGTTWAYDCAAPASANNYRLSYRLGPNGFPIEAMRSAPGDDKDRELHNVQFISPEWMLYTMFDTDGDKVNILTRTIGDRKKSWWSTGADAKNYIRDGVFPGSGGPPWFTRCK